jgi:hypothetical protein
MFGETSITVLVVPLWETSHDSPEVSDLATNVCLSFGTEGRSSLTYSLDTLDTLHGSRRNPVSLLITSWVVLA